MRYVASGLGSLGVMLLAFLFAPASWAEESAPTTKQVAFDCEDGSVVVATYFFQPPRQTPVRASATLDGKPHELIRDGDASGWGYGDDEVWLQTNQALLIHGPKPVVCKTRGPYSGVPAAIANQSAPATPVAPAAVKPAAVPPTAGTAPPPAAPAAAATPPAKAAPAVAAAAPAKASTPAATAAVTPEPAAPAVAAKPASPAPAKPATVAAKPAVYVICRADWNPDLRNFYNPPVDGRGAGYPEWQASWHQYLVARHKFKESNFGCTKYPTREEAQAGFEEWVVNARQTPTTNGQPARVIITNWKY